MRSDDVGDHITNRKHAHFERLLSIAWLILRESPFQNPDQRDAENTRDHKHYGVPGDGVLRRVWAKSGFRRRTKFCEERFPQRIGVSHLEPVDPLASRVVNSLDY